MPRGSQKNSVVWRHFQVEERDTVSHRRKGRCLHCLTNFHDCRFDSLQKHLLYQCNAIPESLKEELGKSIEVSKPEPTTATKQSKRKAKEVETKPDESNIAIHQNRTSPTSDADVKAAADLVQATWRHFHIGPRDSKNHRRIAECTHCRGTCANPRTERLQAHLLRFCKEISSETRDEYRQFCDSLAVAKHDTAVTSSGGSMRAQVAEYGSFSESSATALGKSFEPNKNLFGSRFQVESGAQSASSSVSADEVLATTAPDTTHKVIEVLAPPLVQWTDVDHFEIVMMSSLQASASTCSDSKPRSIVSGTSVTSAKTDGGDNGSTDQPNGSSPVSDYSQYKYTCRYCHEEFLGIQPTSAAPLKDHILYACSTIPRERLSRLVESELLAPV